MRRFQVPWQTPGCSTSSLALNNQSSRNRAHTKLMGTSLWFLERNVYQRLSICLGCFKSRWFQSGIKFGCVEWGCLGSGYSFALKSGREVNVFFSATKIIHCRNSQATSLNKWRLPPDPPVGSLYEVRGLITFATVLTIYDVEGEGDTLALINKTSV